jgi:hypothetical protein
MDFVQFFQMMFNATSDILVYFNDQISAAVIALAFIMSLIRITNEGWKSGHDKVIPFIKDQITKFAVVVVLCLPLGIVPGYPNNSFLTAFPKAIMDAGFSTTAGLLQSNALGDMGARYLANLPEDTTRKVNIAIGQHESDYQLQQLTSQVQQLTSSYLTQIQNNISFTNILAFIISGILALLFILIMVLVPFIILIVTGGPIAILMLVVIVKLVFLVLFGAIAGVSGLVFGNVVSILGGLLTFLATFIFSNGITIVFYIVMISVVLKSTIYILTFPFSIVNLTFESRRNIFITHIAKGATYALTPVVAAIVYVVAVHGYALIVMDDGIFETFVTAFVGDIPETDPNIGFGILVVEMLGWIAKLVMVSVMGPMIVLIPTIKLMAKSESFAADAIGQGVAVTLGASASAMNAAPVRAGNIR